MVRRVKTKVLGAKEVGRNLAAAGERGDKMAKVDYPQDSLTRIGQCLGVSASEALTMLSAAEASYHGGAKWKEPLRSAVYEEMRCLYQEERISGPEICQRLNATSHLVHVVLQRYGVQMRSSADALHLRHERQGSLTISDALLEIIQGELLGDGCIGRPKAKTAPFVYGTQKPQYLEWLVQTLGSHGLHGPDVHPYTWPDGRVTHHWSSRWEVALADLRRTWYPDGKKRVPRSLALTPVMCRHWYIGDGTLHHRRNFIYLCTHGFPHDDVFFLKTELERVGIVSAIHTLKGKFAIYLNRQNARRFIEYIGPCPREIDESYGYKWRVA